MIQLYFMPIHLYDPLDLIYLFFVYCSVARNWPPCFANDDERQQ